MITLKNKSNGKLIIASDSDLMVKDFIIQRCNAQLARFKECCASNVPKLEGTTRNIEKDLNEYLKYITQQKDSVIVWNKVFDAFLQVAPASHLQKAVARAETEEYIIERID